ncbi:sensor histidine kinase [Streptomyces europaeiscabiei]|uniref:sensor histidine kinase n=1 Tax=Streptomyces europaeiscabiei TaxID=146819 RepID=UPI002E189B1B|nr:sensor histidine kinase [Streptomyces europaeiscabiei]WUD38147.1 sensor histidine kinase [Streptomyces europaeiscabiei]
MKSKGQRHLYALDLSAALALTAVYVGFARLTADDGQPAFTGPPWLGCLIAAAVGLPIAVRRRWPLPVLMAVLAALATASLLDIPREPYAAAGLAAYLVGLAEPARQSVLALAVTLPVAGGAVYLSEAVVTPAEDQQGAVGMAGLVLLVIGGAWAVGFTVRGRRAEAARELRRRSKRALDEERLRIARELHDIVSHNLSLIAVKAGVAGHVAEADPREARAALKVIEETSRSALTEMRRTLGVLRTEGAPLGPVPDLDRLDSLAAEAHRAGVDVDLTVHATEGLAEGTQLTIYRIVQEALTNAVRHAAPTRCQVTVEADAREVRIDVADEGPPSARGRSGGELPGGHGLLGMRERAMMYGGSFEAGPRPEGGFAVSVRLPVEGNQ